ncbi:MAG: hypothetical protein R6V55_08935 [Desulfovermiculus sp.]
MTKVERKNQWAARIAEFKVSGQSVRAWCADHGVNPRQMWYWLKKERQESADPKLSWLPLDLSNASLQNALVIRIGRVAIDVKPGFDPKLLLDVVKTLALQ